MIKKKIKPITIIIIIIIIELSYMNVRQYVQIQGYKDAIRDQNLEQKK